VTGFGVIDKNGSTLTYVTSGRIRTPDGGLDRRLKVILEGLADIITEHRPAQDRKSTRLNSSHRL